jgi:CDP-glycerol glycerophosphotransferase (TagB/SpsB family)
MADKEQVNNAVEEEKPYLWFEYKPDTVIIAPKHPPIPTPQDNRELIEQQAKQIAELTALVQQLISNK